MTISSLLLHCDDDANNPDRIRVAIDLARRFKAHLTAVYVNPTSDEIPETYGHVSARGYLNEELHMARQKARDGRRVLLERCEREKIPCDWIWERGAVLSVLSNHSYHADLAIVSQTPPSNLEERLFDYMPDHLSLTGSCPVLILPQKFKGDISFHHPLVAWKNSRESSHAVRGVLPILRDADNVTVVSVAPDASEAVLNDRFLTWFALHGVTPVFEQIESRRRKIARVIIDAAREKQCDVIVMGGYGKSRLRELMLGGVTHTFLKKMPLPILMGH